MAKRVQLSLLFEDTELYDGLVHPWKVNKELNSLVIKLLSVYYYSEDLRAEIDSFGEDSVVMINNKTSYEDSLTKARDTLAFINMMVEGTKGVLEDGIDRINEIASKSGGTPISETEFGLSLPSFGDLAHQGSNMETETDIARTDDTIYNKDSDSYRGISDTNQNNVLDSRISTLEGQLKDIKDMLIGITSGGAYGCMPNGMYNPYMQGNMYNGYGNIGVFNQMGMPNIPNMQGNINNMPNMTNSTFNIPNMSNMSNMSNIPNNMYNMQSAPNNMYNAYENMRMTGQNIPFEMHMQGNNYNTANMSGNTGVSSVDIPQNNTIDSSVNQQGVSNISAQAVTSAVSDSVSNNISNHSTDSVSEPVINSASTLSADNQVSDRGISETVTKVTETVVNDNTFSGNEDNTIITDTKTINTDNSIEDSNFDTISDTDAEDGTNVLEEFLKNGIGYELDF